MDQKTIERMAEAVQTAIEKQQELLDMLEKQTIPALMEMECKDEALYVAQYGMLRLGYVQGVLEQVNILMEQELRV